MKFEVGQKVVVQDQKFFESGCSRDEDGDFRPEDSRGSVCFNPEMLGFCGKEVTISNRRHTLLETYGIAEDHGEWVWQPWMFKI